MLFSTFMATAATTFVSLEPSAPLADLYVDAAAANCVTGTGTISAPVCSISAGVALASAGDTIRIAPGTYVENVGIGIDLELIGVGGPDVTIVDGGGTGSVVLVSVASTVRIEGLTVTGGVAPLGGGIDFRGDLLLVNSTITGNVATGFGGGGIASSMSGSSFTTIDCEVSNNQALLGDGGGVLVGNSDCTLNRTLVEGNTASMYGGGVQFSANNTTNYALQIIDSTVRDNEAVAGSGGGVLAGGTVFFLQRSTISGNTAGNGGGGANAFGTGLEFSNSTISGNTAGYGGGLLSGETWSLEPSFIRRLRRIQRPRAAAGGSLRSRTAGRSR